jgi:hypothetical protein
LTSPEDEHNDFCVLKGTIPPGVSVPLHSHPDTEDFFIISGSVEGLRHDAEGYKWIAAKAGDYIHVPVAHSTLGVTSPVNLLINLIITTKKLGRFFREAGRPVIDAPQPMAFEHLTRFATISAKYGYWNATPEENAAVGIDLSF